MTFPGGTSVSHLEVYRDAAPDGLRGGSPHVHLVSSECYIVVGGRGRLQTVDGSGSAERTLEPGAVVWFTPGTIHRAVNDGDLSVVVLMSNAGLPEAGDAVLTFPAEVLASAERYAAAATLPAGERDDVIAAARARRDLAVDGFTALRAAIEAGDVAAYKAFLDAATALASERSSDWERIVRDGPVAAADESLAAVRAIARGDASSLADARVSEARAPAGERRFGMCGMLRPYDTQP